MCNTLKQAKQPDFRIRGRNLKKLKKAGIILALPVFLAFVSIVQASGRTYLNKTIDELKTYVDDSNLNIKSEDSEYLVMEGRYNELVSQKNENLKKTALLQNQIDRLNFTKGQHHIKREQIKLIEKHLLQTEYYNVCMLIKQSELAQSELEAAEKMVTEIEEKFRQGDATKLEVDDAISKRKQAKDRVDVLKYSIEQEENSLKIRLNENNAEQFTPKFTIPSEVEDNDHYTIESLKKNCTEGNLQLLQMNAYIGFHNTLIENLKSCAGENDASYQLALSERSKMQVEADILKQKIQQYAEKQFNNLKSCRLNYNTSVLRKPILIQKLDKLKIKYSEGIISEAEYLSSKNQVLKELLDADNAVVALINALSLADLVNNGIMQ